MHFFEWVLRFSGHFSVTYLGCRNKKITPKPENRKTHAKRGGFKTVKKIQFHKIAKYVQWIDRIPNNQNQNYAKIRTEPMRVQNLDGNLVIQTVPAHSNVVYVLVHF